MMYSPGMFPDGTCAFQPGCTPDPPFDLARYRSRRHVQCRYYFIDFGHSTSFESFADRRPMLTPRGQYRDAPEFNDTPCDGFKLDVWCLGKLVHDEFTSVCVPYPLRAVYVANLNAAASCRAGFHAVDRTLYDGR